jgi:hypothetical protein
LTVGEVIELRYADKEQNFRDSASPIRRCRRLDHANRRPNGYQASNLATETALRSGLTKEPIVLAIGDAN